MAQGTLEAAAIQDGFGLEFCLRRARPRQVEALPHHLRVAVETYAATAEAVLAGGASQPRDSLTLSGGGGSAGLTKDGRQAAAVDQVTFLRTMESAVGSGVMRLGRRDPVEVPVIEWWRAVCLGDATVAGFLSKRGLSRTATRNAALADALRDAAQRVADAVGATRNPYS